MLMSGSSGLTAISHCRFAQMNHISRPSGRHMTFQGGKRKRIRISGQYGTCYKCLTCKSLSGNRMETDVAWKTGRDQRTDR